MTTPVSKTPEKNAIKAVVDPQGIPVGVEVQIDGIGLSVPIEQFCAIDSDKALPRATFSSSGIRREIFVDTANNTAYVRRIREKDNTAIASTEEVQHIVVTHIEKSVEIVVILEESEKSTHPAPSPTENLVQGAVDSVTQINEKPSDVVPSPQFQTGFNIMNWSDSKSVSTVENKTQSVPLREIAFANATSSAAEINILGAHQMCLAKAIAPEQQKNVELNQSETGTHSVAESPNPRTIHFSSNELQSEALHTTGFNADIPRDVASTNSAESDNPVRTAPMLRGPGLFEKLGTLIASFKQSSEPNSDPLFAQMVTPLSGVILPTSPMPRLHFNDMHSVEIIAKDEGSRDSSDGQQQSQDEQPQEEQDPRNKQESQSEASAQPFLI